MFIRVLNWRRSIVVVGLIALLLLLGSSNVIPETKLVWGGWWVHHQRLPATVSATRKVRVKLPEWYLRLRGAIAGVRRWLREEKLGWWIGSGVLILLAIVWVWFLRVVLTQMMREERISTWQGNWGWNGMLSDSAVMQVRLQVTVSEDGAMQKASEIEQGFIEVREDEVASVIEDGLVETATPVLASARLKQCGEYQLLSSVTRGDTPTIVKERNEEVPNGTEQVKQKPLNIIALHFCDLKDPRMERTKKHHLLDIATITICAVVGGADNWVEVAEFGQSKEEWFKSFLELPNGIPSHDTFGRVFRLLDPQQWQAGFLSWVEAITQSTKGQIVPIDGKCLRRSHDKTLGHKAIHMVSAWASDSRVVLGQIKVDEKSNEISAIPTLLEMLTLTGCIVTIDAMGCQTEIAKKVIDKGGDYALALKKNQKGLYEGVKVLFDKTQAEQFEARHYHKTVEKSHGRQEIRQCWTISDPKQLSGLHNLSAWKGLQTVVKVRAEQQRGDKTTIEERYYISSLSGDAEKMLQVVRGHWSIENSLHWVLDIAFREDDCRIRKGYGAQNFAVLRHLALNLLEQDTTAKCGIKAKRKKAGWDENFLLNILANST